MSSQSVDTTVAVIWTGQAGYIEVWTLSDNATAYVNVSDTHGIDEWAEVGKQPSLFKLSTGVAVVKAKAVAGTVDVFYRTMNDL